MGKKLDSFMGKKGFKTYKFKPLVNLSISRLAVLKHQRQVRCSQAQSDVLQLLVQGHHERALLRVEQVIKEQNMLDVYALLESFCHVLTERVHLIEEERECPDELKEAISSLLFASSRCGDFPELQEIRAVFTSRYGKEFTARAIELRNNCGVNPKIIQKLSTRQTGLENRMKVLKKIAAENNISLQLEGGTSSSAEILQEKIEVSYNEPGETSDIGRGNDSFGGSLKTGRKYKDVADAAQAAFESAAYAAAAARAAVELSRTGSDPRGPDDRGSSKLPHQTSYKPEAKIQQDSKSVMSESSSDSRDDIVEVPMTDSDDIDPMKLLEKDIVFIESDSEANDSDSSSLKTYTGPPLGRNAEVSKPITEIETEAYELGSSSLKTEATGPSVGHVPEVTKLNAESENETRNSPAEIKSSSGLNMKAGTEPTPARASERRKHHFNFGMGLFSRRNRGRRRIIIAISADDWGIYIVWLFLLPYAPGDPVWAISSETVNALVGLSLNFFFILPLMNAVGIHVIEAPVLHPMAEGLFNFVIGWTFMFAPLLFTDSKRDRYKGSLDVLWGFQMFLTNTFLIPYMAIRLNKPDDEAIPNKRSQLGSLFTNGAPVVGLIGGAACLISVLWAFFGRADGNFGSTADRWQYLVSYLGSERLAYAFIWDICLYLVFQPWLIGGNLQNVKENKVDLVNYLRFVPVVGLVAYSLFLNCDEEP
ncbi:hypothetical protein ACFE04_031239 [Oxalis oulophora]